MLGLNPNRYHKVPIKNINAKPWFLSPKHITKLKQTAKSISEITGRKTTPDSWIQNLGISTVAKILPSFVNKSEWDKHQEQICGYLPTEHFLEDRYYGIGSSRHVLTKNYQIKGVGRNQLVVDNDYYHNWGGYPARDALRSLISDFFLKKRSTLGPLETHAILVHHAEGLDFPLALSYRDNNTYRLAQINGNILTLEEVDSIKKSIYKQLGEKSLLKSYIVIRDHYITAFLNGINYRSLSTQNLTSDGRFIDTESIDFTIKKEPLFWIEQISKSHDAPPKLRSNRLYAKNSWYHELEYMCRVTAQAFDQLTQTERISEYHNKSFYTRSLSLIPDEKKMISSLNRSLTDKKLAFKSADFPSLHFNLSQVHLGKSLYTHRYSTNTEDPRVYGLKLLQKTEFALWFDEKTADIKTALENWRKLEKVLRAIA